jgi:hypothetical protein
VFGREDILIVANKDDKFEVLLFIPLSLSNFFALFLHLRFHEFKFQRLLLHCLIDWLLLVVMVDTAVDERHATLILYRIQKNYHK